MTLSFPQGHQPRYASFHLDGLIDETLREGAERCLFAVDEENKFTLAKALVGAGIRDLVIGSGPDDPDLLLRCLKAKFELEQFPMDAHFIFIILLNSWEAMYEQFKHFPQEYLKEIPFSFGMVEYQQNEQLLERVVEKFAALGATSFRVSLLNNFSSGVDEEKYAAITAQIERCVRLGFKIIRINDSLGRIYPETMAVLAANLVHDYPHLDFCLHAHDDHGLGLINALTSVYHGFNMIEGAIAGYGNRSGLPSIETLEKICREKDITIGDLPLDSQKLIAAAKTADEVFITIPSLYRPVSGVIVDKENLGVLNIPDYLGIERETDYFLNSVGLHQNTIVRTLQGAGFDGRYINDHEFIATVRETVKMQMKAIYEHKRAEYHDLSQQVLSFYQSGVLGALDITETAKKCAAVSSLS